MIALRVCMSGALHFDLVNERLQDFGAACPLAYMAQPLHGSELIASFCTIMCHAWHAGLPCCTCRLGKAASKRIHTASSVTVLQFANFHIAIII